MIDEKRLSEVISKNVCIRFVEPHIYSVFPNEENMNSYDKMFGDFYDFVACSRFYNRLVWGYWTGDYYSLCRSALASSTDGWVLDAGCGSLAFTARAYANDTRRSVVLLDQSLRLLRIAKSRLIKLNGHVPENMVFVHGDALLQEMRNGLSDGGAIFLTTLIENNRFADRYLRMWGKAGEVVPRNADQLFAVFNALDMPVKYRIKGNMAFISSNA